MDSSEQYRSSERKSKRDRYMDRDDDSSQQSHKQSSRHRSHERRVRSHTMRHREYSEDGDNRSGYGRRDREGNESHRSREVKSSPKERKYRHRSASRERSHHRRRSRSPPSKRRRPSDSHSRSRSPKQGQRSRAPLPSQDESFRGGKDVGPNEPPVGKQKPNFKPTGLLAKEANTVTGTTTILKYHEPPEARKPSPKEQWRMYVFKKKDLLDTIYLHERSVWLIGRDQTVTDLLLEHPSISKQHAVLQFRYITSTNEYGDKSSRVKPYIIDLESANGTKLNGKKVEASRYVELVDGDVVAFGDSEREYVLMLPPSGK